MNTEKSCLTWRYAMRLLKQETYCGSNIKIPIGFSYNSEELMVLNTDISVGYPHIFLTGVTGSGVSSYATFLLKSLNYTYGKLLPIGIVDGNGHEQVVFHKLLGDVIVTYRVTSVDSLRFMLAHLTSRIVGKANKAPKVFFLFDIMRYVNVANEADVITLCNLMDIAAQNNVYLVFVENNMSEGSKCYESVANHATYGFGIVCATRLSKERSMLLFGTEDAVNVNKYGDVVCKHNGIITKCRAPYVSPHELYT